MADKATEILIQQVISSTVNALGKGWDYIYNFNDYVGHVEENIEVLKGFEDEMEHVVNVAKWGGKFVGGDDNRWIDHAIKRKKESDEILKEAVKVKKILWKGRLNVVGRFRLSRKAASFNKNITGLINQARAHGKADHGMTPTGMLPTVKVLNHNELGSRKLLLDRVMKALKKDENYMIGIWGMAGVGKTMLADEVMTKVLQEKNFVAAVKVVMSKDLNIPEIQRVIASNLGMELNERDNEDANARRLQSRLMDGSTNLVILDNVWDEVQLHRIGLPLYGMHNGCKVLLTSRNHLMLRTMGANENIEVEPLVPLEAQQLFKKIAHTFPNEDIVEKLTAECGGLPLAIKTVASGLVKRPDLQVWQDTLTQLSTEKKSAASNEFVMDDHVYASIQVSYNRLKSKSDAQRLLLLCCLFPEEENIPVQKLVRYVKGLKLLNVSDSLVDTSCYVFTLLDKLIHYSLLLHGDNKDTTVKINHVVRAVCLSISLKEDTNRLNVKHTPKLRTWPYNKEEQRAYTGISLTFSDQMTSLDLPDGVDYPGLELLQLQFHGKSLNLPENTFKGMKEVRVLDFKHMTLGGEHIRFKELLPVLHILTNLRTLCIEFCDLSGVDLSLIKSLKLLEVLSFFRSKDVTLPYKIQELTNLKLLDFRCDGDLNIIPSKVLPKLKMLEELYLGNFADWSAQAYVQDGPETDPISITKLSTDSQGRTDTDQISVTEPSSGVQDGTETALISITELSELPLLRVLQVRVRESILLLKLEKEAWFEALTKFQIVAIRAPEKFGDYEIGKSIKIMNVDWNRLLKAKIHKLLKVTECLKLESTAFRNLFVEFSGLKTLELEDCDVKYIMDTEDSAETLNKLNYLNVKGMKNLMALCEKELPKKSLVKLETIVLDTLISLKYLWIAQPDSGCLGNLRSLEMSFCKAITCIFPFSVAKDLVQLERLDVKNCEQLKWIVSKEEGEKTGDYIVLKKLNYLSLHGLQNFCSFFPDSLVVKTITTDNAAKLVKKSSCSWFASKPSVSKDTPVPNCQEPQVSEQDVEWKKPLFNPLKSSRSDKATTIICEVQLSGMKTLLIGAINNIEHIVDDHTSMETVKEINKMALTNCQQLLYLAASKQSMLKLQNLEEVNVKNCESMKALFNFGKGSGVKPSKEAVSVPSKLSTITLLRLKNLDPLLLKDPENTSCFGNLKSLEISGCDSLVYIFSVSVAKMLGKLEDLKVSYCEGVKEIIEKEVIEIDGGKKEETPPDLINFSCLRVLQLKYLDSMSSFSSGNHDFNFPKLKDMLVQECENMRTFCSPQRLVRARLLYEVKMDHLSDENEPVPVPVPVPDEYSLNQTIGKLHQMMTGMPFSNIHDYSIKLIVVTQRK